MNVCLLFGGKSTEHYGSIESALHVARYFDTQKYTLHLAYIKEDGSFASGTELCELLPSFLSDTRCNTFPETWPCPENYKDLLCKAALSASGSDSLTLLKNLKEHKFDVVFPVFHGLNGEDGSIQGFLEVLNIPYVGPGISAAAISCDKEFAKIIALDSGVPTAAFIKIMRRDWEVQKKGIALEIEGRIGYPSFVKPCRLGSSIGVGRADNRIELEAALETAFKYDEKVIVEEGIQGHEYAVALTGIDDPDVMPVALFRSVNPAIFDFDSKYGSNSLASVIPAPLDESLLERLTSNAVHVYKAVGLSGLARIDFFIDDSGAIYFNEINSIPGLEIIGTFVKQWKADGREPSALIEVLIACALESYRRKNRLTYKK